MHSARSMLAVLAFSLPGLSPAADRLTPALRLDHDRQRQYLKLEQHTYKRQLDDFSSAADRLIQNRLARESLKQNRLQQQQLGRARQSQRRLSGRIGSVQSWRRTLKVQKFRRQQQQQRLDFRLQRKAWRYGKRKGARK
jgi:hypothetical protein